MATRGRKPKPTALKELAGTPGKRALNKDEPKPPRVVSVEPPTPLPPIARAEWDRLAPSLATKGVLTEWDLEMFANYCLAKQQRDEAEAKLAELRKEGSIVALVGLTPNGMKVMNIYLQIRNSAMRDMATFGAPFGLTPADRSRLTIQDPEKEDADAEFTRA